MHSRIAGMFSRLLVKKLKVWHRRCITFPRSVTLPCGELTGLWGAPILEFWGLRSEGDCGRGKSCHFECGADADWEIYGRAGAVVGDGIGGEGGGGGVLPAGIWPGKREERIFGTGGPARW